MLNVLIQEIVGSIGEIRTTDYFSAIPIALDTYLENDPEAPDLIRRHKRSLPEGTSLRIGDTFVTGASICLVYSDTKDEAESLVRTVLDAFGIDSYRISYLNGDGEYGV